MFRRSVNIRRSAYTWRGLKADESFWPGRLDVASVSGIESDGGYVLDTSRMSDESNKRLGLQKDDSVASDHLMLVLDL